MASCQFKGGKCKSPQQVKAYLKHNDKEKREHTKEHSNQDINKDKTSENIDLLGLSYEEKCKKYDNRISELDATTNKNKRKDRVTMQGIVIPAPKDLPRDKYDAWFSRVHEILTVKYGEDNCIGSDVHYDEEHEYTDPETLLKTVSRAHLHYSTIPVLDGQLNGKWCSQRANIIQINNAIQDMSQQEFGIDFMDGTKRKGHKSTESLKNASKEAELKARENQLKANENQLAESIAKAQAEMEKQVLEVNNNFHVLKSKLDTRETNIKAKESELKTREANILAQQNKLSYDIVQMNIQANIIKQREDNVKAQEEAIRKREDILKKREEDIKTQEEATKINNDKLSKDKQEFTLIKLKWNNQVNTLKEQNQKEFEKLHKDYQAYYEVLQKAFTEVNDVMYDLMDIKDEDLKRRRMKVKTRYENSIMDTLQNSFYKERDGKPEDYFPRF